MKRIFPIVLLLLTFRMADAQIPKPQKHTYVNDFAHVLTKAQVRALNVSIHKIERTSSVQMAVVLVNKLPKDYEIEDFALLIGRKWHVGKNKNGLVYVAAIQQHKQRLEVASKIATTFTDSVCADILTGIKPYFRQHDYNRGLQNLVAEVAATVQPVVKPRPSVNPQGISNQVSKPAKADDSSNVGTIVGLIFVLLVIYVIYRHFRERSLRRSIAANPNQYYNQYVGSNGYQSGYNDYPPNYNPPSSNTGGIIGGVIAGAAAGYAARTIQDHMNHNRHHHTSSSSYTDDSSSNYSSNYTDDDNSVSSNDNDSDNWGNWDSGSSDSGSSDSSSNDGFTGDGGATSDW